LQKIGVETRPLIAGSLARHPLWTQKFDKVDLPNCDMIHKNGLYLPVHQQLNLEEIERISAVFN